MATSDLTAVPTSPKLQDQDKAKDDLWAQALTTLGDEDRKQFVGSSASPREVLQKAAYDMLDTLITSSNLSTGLAWVRKGSGQTTLNRFRDYPSMEWASTFTFNSNMKLHVDSKVRKSVSHLASSHYEKIENHAVPSHGMNKELRDNPGTKTLLTRACEFKVHEATENTKNDCVAKGWRVYRKKNGDEIKLRHVLEKLSKWVEEAIKVVDLGVSFDQSGHSALPWGIVKFIVTTGKSNIDVFSNVVEGVESVSRLITRYTVVENLYLRGSHEATIRLHQSIIEFYAEILTYLARAKSFFSGSSIKQIGRGLIEPVRKQYDVTKISDTDVQRWMRLVDADVHQETAMREIDHYDSLKGILLELNRPITRMTSQLEDLHDHFNSEKRKEIFRWMSEIEYKSHHEDLSKGLLPNSGQWLLDHELFIEWGQSNVSSILWLHGIPGSGKTRLISRIIDVMLDERRSGQSPTAFFYCARSTAEPERGKPAEILGAILRQLCSSKPDRPIRGPVAKEYEIRKQKADEDCSRVKKLSVEDCTRLILKLTKDNPATIVIDALDECDEETRHELLEALDMVISNSTELVKVLVSSRDDVDIALHLDNCKNISISADCNGGDIARFVVSEVDRLISKKLLLDGKVNRKLRRELIDTLTTGAQGMFRWVAMSLETLQKIKFRSDFLKALGQLPSKLSGLYDIVYSQIDMTESYGRDIAIRTLKWLLCAQRLMTAKELIAAISLPGDDIDDSTSDPEYNSIERKSSTESFDKTRNSKSWESTSKYNEPCSDFQEVHNDIIRSCRNLVAVDAQREHFRFAHQSVREYLLAREEYTPEEQHALAAERCLDVYLTEISPNLVNAKSLQRDANLKEYSSFYWPVHYKYAENSGSQALERKIAAFMTQGSTTSPAYTRWASELDPGFSSFDSLVYGDEHDQILGERLRLASAEPKTYLSALCAFGFSSLMKDRRLTFEDCNQVICPQRTYFSLSFSQLSQYSLLSVASREGHDQIVEMLLIQGADVNGQIDGWSALHFASRNGHESTVRILLDKSAHAGLQSQGGSTALLLALKTDHVGVAKLLLENGTNVNARDDDGYSALHYAVMKDYESIVRLLLDLEADLDARDQNGDHPLSLASKAGHESIVKLLLDHGADVNVRSVEHDTPLSLASKSGHESTVKLLLDHEADVNVRNGKHDTSLLLASKKNHESTVKLLLDHGADVNAQNKRTDSALHMTARINNDAITKLLLDYGADVNAQICDNESPLHVAVKSKNDAITTLLLDHDANVNAQDEHGASALHHASLENHISIVKMLLDHGANVNVRDKHGRNALHFASANDHISTVKMLLDHGADTDARTENGEGVLHYALDYVSRSTASVIELLLRHGIDVNARDGEGKSSIDWARAFRLYDGELERSIRRAVVQLLLDHGAIDTLPIPESDSGRVQEVVSEDGGGSQ